MNMDYTFSSLLSYLLLFVVGAVTLLFVYLKHKHSYWRKRGVYSPPCHWLLGHFKNALLMKTSFPQAFADLHNSVDPNTPVIGVYMMHKPILLLRNAEVMKQIFIKDFNIFCDRFFASKRKTDIIGCENLFSVKNPEWRYIRSKLMPAFSTGKLKKHFESMIQSKENLKSHLKSMIPDDGEVTVECRQLCDRYTTDTIIRFAFGIQTDSFAQPDSELYRRSRKVFDLSLLRATQIFATFFFPRVGDLLQGSMLSDSTEYFRNIFWESVNEREKSKVKSGDIIDFLIDLKNEEQSSEFQFVGDYLVAQSAILLFAGLETSAITISFTLLELAKNLEIQNRVREEIREKLSDGELSYEKVAEMTYLSQVVAETLRLYPPAPIIDRVATKDYKLPGTDVQIEKGTAVYVALKGLHEDPHYHAEPLKYDPDRFSEERKRSIKPCTYMPFGEGPRICIGMRIGQLQTMTGLITILNEYEVTLNPKYRTEISLRALFLAPADGVRLNFRKV